METELTATPKKLGENMEEKSRYEMYMKVADDSHEERLNKIRNKPEYYAFTKERHKVMEKFYNKYGRSWYVFVNVPFKVNGKYTWMDQFRVKEKYTKTKNEKEVENG
jgi:hypothetical protein